MIEVTLGEGDRLDWALKRFRPADPFRPLQRTWEGPYYEKPSEARKRRPRPRRRSRPPLALKVPGSAERRTLTGAAFLSFSSPIDRAAIGTPQRRTAAVPASRPITQGMAMRGQWPSEPSDSPGTIRAVPPPRGLVPPGSHFTPGPTYGSHDRHG